MNETHLQAESYQPVLLEMAGEARKRGIWGTLLDNEGQIENHVRPEWEGVQEGAAGLDAT